MTDTTYQNRNDVFYFESLAKDLKKHDEVEGFLVANFVYNPSMWIGEMYGDECKRVFTEWKKQIESLSYNFNSVKLTKFPNWLGKEVKWFPQQLNLYGKTKILRPGAISHKKIGKVLKKNISILKKTKELRSPGLLKRHYSPGIPIKLNCKKADSKTAFVVFGKKYKKAKNIFNLSL